MNRAMAVLVALVMLGLMPGCGGVGVEDNHGPPALRLVHLYPWNGESGVSKTITVLAHFSDDVFASDGCLSSDVVNDETFSLAPCSNPTSTVPALVGCFQFFASDGQTVTGEDRAVAVLSPLQQLAGATEYCLTLDASIHGLNTGSLGASIEAAFTTEP